MNVQLSRLGGKILNTPFMNHQPFKVRMRFAEAWEHIHSIDDLPDDLRAMANEALKQISKSMAVNRKHTGADTLA